MRSKACRASSFDACGNGGGFFVVVAMKTTKATDAPTLFRSRSRKSPLRLSKRPKITGRFRISDGRPDPRYFDLVEDRFTSTSNSNLSPSDPRSLGQGWTLPRSTTAAREQGRYGLMRSRTSFERRFELDQRMGLSFGRRSELTARMGSSLRGRFELSPRMNTCLEGRFGVVGKTKCVRISSTRSEDRPRNRCHGCVGERPFGGRPKDRVFGAPGDRQNNERDRFVAGNEVRDRGRQRARGGGIAGSGCTKSCLATCS